MRRERVRREGVRREGVRREGGGREKDKDNRLGKGNTGSGTRNQAESYGLAGLAQC